MRKLFAIVLMLLLMLAATALAEDAGAVAPIIDLTDITRAVLALIAALITRYVVPWIKARTSAEEQKRIQSAIDIAVFAAEKVFGAGHGEEKKDYVLMQLEEMGFTIDTAVVEAGIEAAVLSMDLSRKAG